MSGSISYADSAESVEKYKWNERELPQQASPSLDTNESNTGEIDEPKVDQVDQDAHIYALVQMSAVKKIDEGSDKYDDQKHSEKKEDDYETGADTDQRSWRGSA